MKHLLGRLSVFHWACVPFIEISERQDRKDMKVVRYIQIFHEPCPVDIPDPA
jgi:hypothetical protein